MKRLKDIPIDKINIGLKVRLNTCSTQWYSSEAPRIDDVFEVFLIRKDKNYLILKNLTNPKTDDVINFCGDNYSDIFVYDETLN